MNTQQQDDRVSLVDKARAIAGPDFDHKGLSDREVMTKALAKKAVVITPDHPDDYVKGAFDAHAESAKKGGRMDGLSYREDGAPIDIVARARELMIERHRNAWKQPLTATSPQHTREDGADPLDYVPDPRLGIIEQARAKQRHDSHSAWKRPLSISKKGK